MVNDLVLFYLFLGLDKGECTYEDIERAKTMVPKTFQKYVESKLSQFLLSTSKFKTS